MEHLKSIPLEELFSYFGRQGYELSIAKPSKMNISLEESIVAALLKKEPRLIEGIPTLLTKNKVDYDLLTRLIDSYELWNEFGYLADFTMRNKDDSNLGKLIFYCKGKLKRLTSLYGSYYEFFKAVQKKEEREWNLIGAPSYELLKKQFKRYNNE